MKVEDGSTVAVVGPQAIPPVHTTYSTLVEDPYDLVGLIAYSLYKREKLDFLETRQAKHGSVPTPDELLVFYQLVNMPGQVEALRTRSATLLEQVTEVVLEEAVQQMEQDYQVKLMAELKKPKSFSRAVTENVVANIVAAGLVTLAVVLFYLSRVDAIQIVGRALGYEITATQSK